MLDKLWSTTKKSHKPHVKIWMVYPRNSPLTLLTTPTHTLPAEMKSRPLTAFIRNDDTFHNNMKLFLTMLQAFGVMPIYGCGAPSAKSLRFLPCSLRSLYAALVIAANLTIAAFIIRWNILTGYSFDKVFSLIWWTVNPFLMVQFIRVAGKWPSLMQHWELFERVTAHRDVAVHRRMRRLIFAASVGIPVAALAEHVLSLCNNWNTANLCESTTDTLSAYFRRAFPGIFYFFEVNYFNGSGIQLLNLYATVVWSMTDAFILLVSLGLITQFMHFNRQLEKLRGTEQPVACWEQQRAYFTKLTELLDHVNKDLAVLIVTSFMVNAFYICVQLFGTTRPRDSAIPRIYFWFSVAYMVGKMFLVLITGSFINEEAKKPIRVLESVPASSYGAEAARFMQQLTSGTIALGGMQFFYITRSFLVSMVGTLVTYEIILIQFQGPYEGYNPCGE